MGMRATNDAWSGSCSGFNAWRNRIAIILGIGTKEFTYKGAMGFSKTMIVPNYDEKAYTAKNYMGMWKSIPEEPIMLLLAHSDCEGVLKVKHLKLIVQRLEEMLAYARLTLSNEPQFGFYEETEKFIDGAKKCIEQNVQMEFH